ncbi:MAG TPA: aldo/keto reductase [Candidatus Obscuribacterales bacterium]
MQKRRLGRSDLQVAPLSFGGNVFGWTADEETSFKLLDGFVHAGLNLVDTADVYSVWAPGHKGGESETIIGKWLKKRGTREDVVIATKCGMKMSSELGVGSLSKKYIFEAIDASLKRLQTDYVDLYQAHTDDPNTPLEETLEAFTDLIKQGKVRAVGASNYKAPRLTEALRISEQNGFARYESLQPEYNLLERSNYETKLEHICVEHELGVISYFSLARGFLTGKYKSESDLSKSPRGDGVTKYMNDRGFKIVRAVEQVAERQKVSPAAVALAWLMARPSVTAPIASATSVDQLENLIQATKITLSDAEMKALNYASQYEHTAAT